MTITKSCFNCSHLDSWNYPATLEDPPESGWDCGNDDAAIVNYLDSLSEPDGIDYTDPDKDAKIGELWASECPGYSFKDWESGGEDEAIIEPSETELAQWNEQMARVQLERYIDAGLITADGELTGEYYRQSDMGYDAARESRR